MNKEIIKKKIEPAKNKNKTNTTHKTKYKPNYKGDEKTVNKNNETNKTSNFVYALDRYTNKNIKVLNIDKEISKNLKA
jgi:hypothetical protein